MSEELLKRLGLSMGNCGDDSWAHNGSWYDNTGHKVGWGDLGVKDIVRIQAGLQDGEVLWVVGEHDSFWDLPKGLRPEAPGIEFVQSKARYAITNRKVLLFRDSYEDENLGRWHGDRSLGVKGLKVLKRNTKGYLDKDALAKELESVTQGQRQLEAEQQDAKVEKLAEDRDRTH